MGRLKCDHIKRVIILTSEYIMRFSLYNAISLLSSIQTD